MPPQIALLVFATGILGLFWLDRDSKVKTSKALWIPVMWLWIAGSRPVSAWLAETGLWNGALVSNTANAYLDGSPLDRNVFMVLLAVGVIVLIGRREQVAKLLRGNGPILLFFTYCLLSIAWSDYSDVAFKRWTKAVGDLVMVLIVLTDPQPKAALKRLLARTGFVLLPVSVLLIKYYPDLGRAYDAGTGVWAAWTPMYTGVTTTKNLLGLITLVFGLGAVWRFAGELQEKGDPHRRRRLIAQCTLLAMVFWLFWMASSMTSLSCFLMGGGLIAVTSLSRLGRKQAVVHALVLVMLSVSLFTLFLDPSSGVLGSMGKDPTLTGRTEIWNLVLSMPVNRLVGTGFESFWIGPRLQHIWSLYWWHPNEAHNGYIEVLLNLGWIGVCLLVCLLVTGYRNALAEFRRDRQTGSLKLAYCVIAVLYNFTESAIRTLNPVWVFFLLATVAVPGVAVAEVPASVNHSDDFFEWEPQSEAVAGGGGYEGEV
ncbi:MAG: O-antigen ligase family protein [Terriglobia bacterium]